jgi:hypothetical protein
MEIAFLYRFHSYTAIIEERDGIRVGDVVEMRSGKGCQGRSITKRSWCRACNMVRDM